MNANILLGMQCDWSSNQIGSSNLLPTDDQLNQFVNTLCDSFTSLQTSSDSHECADTVGSENSAVDESVTDSSSCASTQDTLSCQNAFTAGGNQKRIIGKVAESVEEFCKRMKPSEKRTLLNANLNIAIIQCDSSRERLTEKRKSLELFVRMQHNVSNINYTVSYMPRLPEAPTRVDRLMHDINEERCRILGLLSPLEETISSFSSKATKNDFRQLLVMYGRAIIEVIKARQNESICNGRRDDYEAVVQNLIQLIQNVNRLTRQVHTALWCIEVKEQVNFVKSQKCLPKMTHSASESKYGATLLQKSWPIRKTVQGLEQNTQKSTQRRSLSPQTSIYSYTNNSHQKRSKHNGFCMAGMIQHEQTNIHQIMPSMAKKNPSAAQLYAQQQRAQIFQRYCASLKNNRNNGLK